MANINFERFKRLLTRCEEIASEPAMNKGVVTVHVNVLKPAASAFLKAHDDIAVSDSALRKKTRAATEALNAVDSVYRVARAVVLAFEPGMVLPETLRSQPTDTDKMNAIEDLLKALTKYAGEAWADEQLKGDFGVSGALAVAAMKEAIAASNALAKARDVRATAFVKAHAGFIAFKRVVRAALGSKSKQYKRIHLRSVDTEENGKGEPPKAKPAPDAKAKPAPGAQADAATDARAEAGPQAVTAAPTGEAAATPSDTAATPS